MPIAKTISVVVIGRNEGERLRACLASVANMHREDFTLELIYVDSNSTDDSLQIARAAGARTLTVDTRYPTAGLARNLGWQAAGSEYILFLDGDTVLDPDFVRTALPSFADSTIAAVCGNRREARPDRSIYNRVFDLDWNGPAGLVDYCGGDALFLRCALELCNGYDPSLIAGEEPDLCRRLRAHSLRVLHMDIPMTLHDLAITRFSQWWQRHTRTGYAYAQISERYRNTPIPLWLRESRSNILRAVALTLLLNLSILCALALWSLLPLLFGLLFFASLVQRTALRARGKGADVPTRLAYGVHSHLQQIPIFIGQLNYRTRRRKTRPQLVEYK
ncbi:MAG: glycosyltransferase family A protein [Acidobacteriaceae bacterium]|nr:glycosyltransferase family A protein [Acidobacteriaceae bacterium]